MCWFQLVPPQFLLLLPFIFRAAGQGGDVWEHMYLMSRNALPRYLDFQPKH